MKKKKEVSKASEYAAQIKVLGKVYKALGESVKQAIENLKPEGTPRGMSILSISKDGVQKERILNTRITFPLFSGSRVAKEIAFKNVCLLFGNL